MASWVHECIHGGSLKRVDLETGTNGWASPPGNLFPVRSEQYLTKRVKSPSEDCLLSLVGVDWLKSSARIDNVLGRRDNRVALALRKAQAAGASGQSFIFAINLQLPAKEHLSQVFYFATEESIPVGSLLHRFINGSDSFRNSRFKIVNNIVKGPWIVKKAVGKHGTCLIGNALTCSYHRGEKYLEIDVDVGSWKLAKTMFHLVLGHVTRVSIDMGFLVEGKTEEELPERLIGAVRLSHLDTSSAEDIDG
ncbi:hypothetical protein SAY86_030317 [Trapa natans]|uniref:Protein ENHANCED DISEASE RESISTANCE 2 C-terminal domain-containing protein n=1 Tax=Trapa natans TaxID=22666 RepID=A0AAN7MMU9_TRANT|nr:hypothetical protein SAY86_030317 [Trapa natans]